MSRWGVRVEGSYVITVTDGPSAFREEAARRAAGDGLAQAVFWDEGWWLVPWSSVLRADPRPPRRATWRPRKWWMPRGTPQWALAWLWRAMGAERMGVPGGWWRRLPPGQGRKR